MKRVPGHCRVDAPVGHGQEEPVVGELRGEDAERAHEDGQQPGQERQPAGELPRAFAVECADERRAVDGQPRGGGISGQQIDRRREGEERQHEHERREHLKQPPRFDPQQQKFEKRDKSGQRNQPGRLRSAHEEIDHVRRDDIEADPRRGRSRHGEKRDGAEGGRRGAPALFIS